MDKLTLEMSIVAERDGKTLLKTRVPIETLNHMVKTHGEAAVNKSLWEMFNKLMAELQKK